MSCPQCRAVFIMRKPSYRIRWESARIVGRYDAHTDTPNRNLDGWKSEEILAWLKAWREQRQLLQAQKSVSPSTRPAK
jgi:hypothetical protein